MKIYKLPAYAEFGLGSYNYPTHLTFVLDSYMINYLSGLINAGTYSIFRHENFNGDPVEYINGYFGQNLINPTQVYGYHKRNTDKPVDPALQTIINMLGIDTDVYGPDGGTFERLVAVDNWQFATTGSIEVGYLDAQSGQYAQTIRAYGFMPFQRCILRSGNSGYYSVEYQMVFLPDDFFTGNDINEKYKTPPSPSQNLPRLALELRFKKDGTFKCYWIEATTNWSPNNTYYYARQFFGLNFSLKKKLPETYDEDNPYNKDLPTSGIGGGDGTLPSGGLDDVDPALVPSLPSVSAANLGFITMYNPSVGQLQNLADFMWSDAFDLSTYKKLFSDPMEAVIGLAIVPVEPSIGGSKNVHFGSIDSGVTMSFLSTNYVQLDCGSVAVERYIGCFMDNDPYTKISIYLPFIGIRQLSADDVIGGSIHVVYNIDVLTGACACFIEHSERGVLYSYNGSCITNVPLTAINFSGAIQNAVSACLSGVSVMAGMATGAAPITAMGAVGLLNSAANTALNSKPSVQRSGNLGGSAGIMSIQKPYVIIERPSLSVPDNVQHYAGQTANITMLLDNCSGFTVAEFVHIDNVNATANELSEIEALLKGGVIL